MSVSRGPWSKYVYHVLSFPTFWGQSAHRPDTWVTGPIYSHKYYLQSSNCGFVAHLFGLVDTDLGGTSRFSKVYIILSTFMRSRDQFKADERIFNFKLALSFYGIIPTWYGNTTIGGRKRHSAKRKQGKARSRAKKALNKSETMKQRWPVTNEGSGRHRDRSGLYRSLGTDR
jgi:hypothetical protein